MSRALTAADLRRYDGAARPVAVPGGALAVLDEPARHDLRGTAVLVPGLTGSKEDFAPLLPLLGAAGFRAVALDQRGQLDSLGPDDPAAYTVPALAADLCALLEALDAGPVHLVGHSFGGLVTRAAVLADPRIARSLTLLDSGPAALVGPRVLMVQATPPLLESVGLAGVWEALEELTRATDPVAAAARDPEVLAFHRRRFLAQNPVGLAAMGAAILAEPDRVDALAGCRVPVQVMYGEADDAWPPHLQAEMARRLGGDPVVIAGAVHSPAAEQPAATAAALIAFFSSVAG